MAGDRIRRLSWRRSARPRKWHPLMFSTGPRASHYAPKSGGISSVRAHITQMRVEEAADFTTLTVNEGDQSYG